MHQSIHISSIPNNNHFASVTKSSEVPLTRENLMCLDQQPSKENEILARYCQEILLSNKLKEQQRQKQQQMTPSSYRERCQSTPPIHQDVVVASPRILPFPYHNDSYFLPTAEKIQYHHQHSTSCSSTTTSCSSSSRADTCSLLATPNTAEYFSSSEFYMAPSRPHSINQMRHNSVCSSSITNQQPERISLPARLEYSNIIISKSSSKQKQRFLLRRSFSTTSSCSSSSSSSVQLATQQQQAPLSQQGTTNQKKNKKPWLKRILRIFKNNKKNKYCKQQQQQQQTSIQQAAVDQVWYCQYSKNPSPRFEQYYSQQQQVAVVA